MSPNSTQTPLVSVVIPTYNYGRYVAEAVDSVLAQTYPAVEVVVVDDGSTDDTRDRLAGYGDRIRYIYQANAGLSAARNTGIRNAAGAFVALLDSDDAFHPRKLELQVAYLRANPQVGLLGTSPTNEPDRRWVEPPDPVAAKPVELSDLVVRVRFGPSSVVIRRECFDTVGLFDTELRSVEDRDYWIRVATRHAVAVLDAPLTWYRQHSQSMSRNAEKMTHYERVVLDKAFAMPELRRRGLLRRRAMGVAAVSSAIMYRDSNRPWFALKQVARSFAYWPALFTAHDVAAPLIRTRLAVNILHRLLRHSGREQ